LSKIAIVTDMHIGVRGDSKLFLDHQERFFSEVFFPYIDEHDIKIIFDLGDTFDRRKFINYVSLERGKKFFFDQIANRGIEYHALVGNHTTYYTNTNEVNSMNLLLREYDKFHIYEDKCEEIQIGSTKFLMVPWINNTNYKDMMNDMRESDADVCMGHFSIQGFEMDKGHLCDHGLTREVFTNFEAVYSGHFHHPSTYNNISYLGSPYEMTWSDYQGKRGFRVLDTETREMDWILNPNVIFYKLEYDDTDMTIEDIANLDVSNLKDTFIKVIVKNRTNPYIYDLFLNKLTDAGAADVKSIEDSLNLESEGLNEIMDETKDTKDILHTYIDSLETKVDKIQVKRLIDELYVEAQSL
jgi:DNA repair exonuclease SbcCD nuclease subunit